MWASANWIISCSAQRKMRSGIFFFAKNPCGEGGRKKFAVLETKRGLEVAETGRFFEALQENQDRDNRD